MIDSGMLSVCKLETVSKPGAMPAEKLVVMEQDYYSERTVGYNRYYAALGANQNISMMVRLFGAKIPDGARYVVLEDGRQYRISYMQKIVEKDCTDLTLSRLEENYDVISSG